MNKSEPVGEEVEVVGVIRMDSDFVWEVDGPYALWRKLGEGVELMTVTQHQRLLEEAKQGQRVLAMECEQLKAQIPEYDELCHRHGVLQVTAREIQKERDQLKAELATAWGNAEKNARDCDDLRAQLARHDDATHNMAELLKRGAKAVGADPDNTWKSSQHRRSCCRSAGRWIRSAEIYSTGLRWYGTPASMKSPA
jgi:hypothetical protein